MGIAKRRVIPQALFLAGALGSYSDINTYATNYYTDAGTTPATIGDPIYQINGQSGNGIVWTQATATARPVLSARYNLLESTEDFSDASWLKTRLSVADNVATAPDSTTTAAKLIPNTDVNTHYLECFSPTTSGQPEVNVFLRSDGSSTKQVTIFPGGSNTFAHLNMDTQTFIKEANVNSATAEDVGGGWLKITVRWEPSIITSGMRFRIYCSSGSVGAASVAGNGVDGVFIWHPDLRLTRDTDQPAYQRVGDLGADPSDYDTVGFDEYLKFDLGDDSLSCTLAAGTYTVALPTREGIFFDSVTHAGGTFSLGPTSYTGGPDGILEALATGSECRLIGPPVLLDRALTAAEQAALVQWLQNRGAGVELELGPELVTNGTFDSDLSGWINQNARWRWESSRAYNNGTGDGQLSQAAFPESGPYFISVEKFQPSGAIYVRAPGAGGQGLPFIPGFSSGEFSGYHYAPSAGNISCEQGGLGGITTAWVDNISVRKLQPKGA